ncbi:PREDICTED: COMM domain-containing protein 2 [Pseudopodoces humilis]|nr:PREDICTED: COMM domain-containing protein 2 [Pseudopodoces humilis]
MLTCGPRDPPRAHLPPAVPRSPGGLGRRHSALRAIRARAGSPACRGGRWLGIAHWLHGLSLSCSPAGAWLRTGSRPAARGRAATPGPKPSPQERLAHLGHIWGTSGAHLGHIWGTAGAHLGHGWGTSGARLGHIWDTSGAYLGHGWGTAGAHVLRGQEAVHACNSTDTAAGRWNNRIIRKERKRRINLLPHFSTALGELGRLALEQLRRGAAPRACETAARKLNIGIDTIQHGVEGLVYLLTESSKLMISEVDFQDSIHVLGFSDELNKSLLQLYLDNRKEIRSILGELAPRLPSYHSLEWRLDVQLASRSLRQQIKPAVTMKLHLNQNEDQTAQVLQTDPATLLHLIQQLEQALGEMKMNHCRRIVRNMK